VSADGSTVRTTVLIEKPKRTTGISAAFRKERTAAQPLQIDRLSKANFRLLTVIGMAGGFWIGLGLMGVIGFLAPVIGAFLVGSLPRIYRSQIRDRRLSAIEEQFPDALDFLSRSVRAGNAFSIAIELLASEAAEPLKSEVAKITREMALGASLDHALYGMAARIPLLEIRMFVAAVLLQRETGGNLSEVLGKLAASVRERLRLRGQVKASSGSSRLTANVLTVMPIATIILLKLVSPSYVNNLFDDPIGRNLLGAAVVSQILGYLVMQKIIKVKV
jgi:tight adherence protein B